MKFPRSKSVAAALIGIASIIATRSPAQSVASPAPPQAEPASADTLPPAAQQVDQLVAPVALYDDALLVDVLTASGYPAEVVEAQRWISDPANAALTGDALATALANQTWNPSVKALVSSPQILNLMNNHLDWTEHLGQAFVADRAAVMDSIQRMRHRAQSAGTLKSSMQQTVASDGDFVTITPPASEFYVPAYDPWCVYGAWQVSAPFYYTSGPGYCAADDGMRSFGAGFYWPFGYGAWGGFDWRHHDIRFNHDHPFHSGHDSAGDIGRHHRNGGARAQFARSLSSTRAMSGGFGGHHFGRTGVASLHLGSGGGHLGGGGLGAAHFGGGGFGAGHFGGGGFGGGHFGGGGFGGGHGGGGHR